MISTKLLILLKYFYNEVYFANIIPNFNCHKIYRYKLINKMDAKQINGYITQCLNQVRLANVDTADQGKFLKEVCINQLENICVLFKGLTVAEQQILFQRKSSQQKHKMLQYKYQVCRKQMENIIQTHHRQTMKNLASFMELLKKMNKNLKSVESKEVEQQNSWGQIEKIFGGIVQQQTNSDEELKGIIQISNQFFKKIINQTNTHIKNHGELLNKFKAMISMFESSSQNINQNKIQLLKLKEQINKICKNDDF